MDGQGLKHKFLWNKAEFHDLEANQYDHVLGNNSNIKPIKDMEFISTFQKVYLILTICLTKSTESSTTLSQV